MDTDLRDELQRCLGDEPPLANTDLLARGRTVLRRRRLAEAASMVAAAVVVVACTALVSGGSRAGDSDPPIAAPSAPGTTSYTIVTDSDLLPGEAVRLLPDHQIHVRPGVALTEVVVDPLDTSVWPESTALAYVQGGTAHWYLGYLHTDDSGQAHVVTARRHGSFTDWVAAYGATMPVRVTTMTVDADLPASDPIAIDSLAGLHVRPDVHVVRVLSNPFGRMPPRASSAAIYERDGQRYWFVASVSNTGAAADARPAGADADFDAWVAAHADMPEVPDDTGDDAS